jgi:hypothetical protein
VDSFLLIDSWRSFCQPPVTGIDYKRKVHQRRDQEIARFSYVGRFLNWSLLSSTNEIDFIGGQGPSLLRDGWWKLFSWQRFLVCWLPRKFSSYVWPPGLSFLLITAVVSNPLWSAVWSRETWLADLILSPWQDPTSLSLGSCRLSLNVLSFKLA